MVAVGVEAGHATHSKRCERFAPAGCRQMRVAMQAVQLSVKNMRPGQHQRGCSAVQFQRSQHPAQRRTRMVVHAGKRETLPIFPLSVVSLPSADVPLQIFEARYRVLFSTLLAGSEGIEDGLVSEGKPWLGTRRFGMVFYDAQAGGIASIGTVLEIQRHVLMDDGRLLVENVGKERFRILNVEEEKPVLLCNVEYLDEDEDSSPEADALRREVGELFRSLVSLSVKLRAGQESPLPPDVVNPPQLSTLDPCQFSYWVSSLFAGSPLQQQALLEMNSTKERLQTVKELLGNTVKYMGAQAALASAFKASGTEADVPPPGGPD